MPRLASLVVVLTALLTLAGDASAQDLRAADVLLSRPLSPGTIAFMVEHGEWAAVHERLAVALADPRSEVRAAAARVVFVLGLRHLAPQLSKVFQAETAQDALFEQARAIASWTGPEQDAATLDAARRVVETMMTSSSGDGRPAGMPRSSESLLQTASDYPKGFMADIFAVTGCDLRQATTAEVSAGAGVVTLDRDGRVRDVSIADTGTPAGPCADAVRVLLRTYARDPSPGLQEGVQNTVVIPFDQEYVACQSERRPVGSVDSSGTQNAVSPPTKTRDVRPVYPPAAIQDRVQGVVVLDAVVSTAGCISSLKVVQSPDPRLAWPAAQAVIRWRFTPTVVNGRPVPVMMTVTVNFALQ